MNGHLTAKFRDKIATETDERSRVMNEVVLAIRKTKISVYLLMFLQSNLLLTGSILGKLFSVMFQA